eukprot:scaffold182000_cov22-Tisochrysis_lutea.AAC.2
MQSVQGATMQSVQEATMQAFVQAAAIQFMQAIVQAGSCAGSCQAGLWRQLCQFDSERIVRCIVSHMGQLKGLQHTNGVALRKQAIQMV